MKGVLFMLETDDLQGALPQVAMPLPGPNAKKILTKRSENVPSAVLCSYPVVINRGSGAMIEDVDGNRFLDWVAGVGVMNVGYGQQRVIDAVKKQADKFFHGMINITTHATYVDLAARINELAPVNADLKKTMFVNSGAEAVENAVKIAKSFTGRGDVIVFSGAFHGRTALTSTMTAKKTYSYGIEPAMGGIHRAEFPYLYRAPRGYSREESIQYYLDKLQYVFEQGIPAKQVAAIVIEPIQGEGGFIPAPFEYVAALRKICDENGIMLVADEVQTGFARSGKLFVSSYWKEKGFAPDIIAMAKSIGAGLPLAAVTAGANIMEGVQPGIVGSTFGGNALACAAGLQVLDIIKDQKLTERAKRIGEIAFDGFSDMQSRYEEIGDVRGIGSMLGVEFVKDRETKEPYPELVAKIIKHAVSHGLIIENAGVHDNVIRFLSPLVATEDQIHAGLKIFETSIKESLAEV
ncbi:(S)-3-amino-2-methylpropionate transaminase [Lentilactobacillus farraginis DSM 18382 = JCM 14108]|uniref:(S)-3-amino-2-methylpropionate transaminase n=2 Tax=Lentilactobacillus farraginis DSM 18382 = JCM 14108 TaxID=1423743 RepID=A0A0R1W609_9LACO|nr:(S)-3-amino-2-methylpropionate transaminase [Lentilactobacillus farraginis DSM 18382 = JCM 14108]